MTKQILRTNFCNGKKHDLRLFKENQIKLPEQVKILGDSGYQGIKIIHPNSQTPIKSSKLIKLTKDQKKENRQLSSQRISVEHANREIKIFKITSERYRNRRKRFGLRVNLIAGWYNFELGLN